MPPPRKTAEPAEPVADLPRRREDARRNVLRANRSMTVILAVVFLLGFGMMIASFRAQKSQRRAEQAETSATERLWHSYHAQARAERLSVDAGHRAAALGAISNAAAIRPSTELRTEAIASLAVRDLVREVAWPLKPRAYGYHIDRNLEFYVVSYTNDALSMFRMADNSHVRDFRNMDAGVDPASAIKEFSFSPTGRYIAMQYANGVVVLWERDTGKAAHVFGQGNNPEKFTWHPSFTRDDHLMCIPSADQPGTVRIVDLSSGMMRSPPEARGLNRTARLSPRGDVISWYQGKEILLLDRETGAVQRRLLSLSEVNAMWWDQAGDQLAVGCQDATLHVWDLRTGRSRQLPGHVSGAWIQLFSPDGTLLTTAGTDGVSRLWHLPTARLLARTTEGRAFVFGQDGERIAYGVPGREVGVWRITNPSGHRWLQGTPAEKAAVWWQDLSPDGRWLAWARPPWISPAGFQIFDLESNGPPLTVETSNAVQVAFHPTKPGLFVTSKAGIDFHEVRAEAASIQLGPPQTIALPESFVPQSASFSGDGQVAAVLGQDNRVLVLDLREPGNVGNVVFLEGEKLPQAAVGPASVTGSGRLAVSPDGRWIAAGTGSRDRRPCIWDARTGKVVRRLPTGMSNVAFSPDGRWLATVGLTECNLWSTGSWEHLSRRARSALVGQLGFAAFNADGSVMAFTRTLDEIELFDPRSGETIASLGGGESLSVNGLRLSADGRRLVATSEEGRMQVWDLGVVRRELGKWRLDWPSPSAAPRPASPAAAGALWTVPTGMGVLGLVAVGVAVLLGLVVLRRHDRLTQEFILTTDEAAQRTRELADERELSEIKSSFVSMVSHEFRTPLGIIQSSAQILDRYLERLPPEQRREQVESITRNVRRMASLIEEVLLLGKMEGGQMHFAPAPIDLASFCRRFTDEMLSATSRHCPIQLEVGELPPARGDERLLRHILGNLLSNAVKYSPAGKPVRFRVAQQNGNAIFTVCDEGLGIPEADRDTLFNAFQRGRNVGQVHGTGLGLTIVKRCVDLHCGSIDFKSEEGRGTTFTVRLPMFDSTPPSRQPPVSP